MNFPVKSRAIEDPRMMMMMVMASDDTFGNKQSFRIEIETKIAAQTMGPFYWSSQCADVVIDSSPGGVVLFFPLGEGNSKKALLLSAVCALCRSVATRIR